MIQHANVGKSLYLHVYDRACMYKAVYVHKPAALVAESAN